MNEREARAYLDAARSEGRLQVDVVDPISLTHRVMITTPRELGRRWCRTFHVTSESLNDARAFGNWVEWAESEALKERAMKLDQEHKQ